jgi:hypothetical protein
MLVTEAMPLPVRGKGTHSFTFEKLKNSTSTTLRHQSLTLEFTPKSGVVGGAVAALHDGVSV